MYFVRSVIIAALLVLQSGAALAASNIQIPRVSKSLRLEDFENMKPHVEAAQLRKISGFTQQQPSDGKPATEKTDIYTGYDLNNLLDRLLNGASTQPSTTTSSAPNGIISSIQPGRCALSRNITDCWQTRSTARSQPPRT